MVYLVLRTVCAAPLTRMPLLSLLTPIRQPAASRAAESTTVTAMQRAIRHSRSRSIGGDAAVRFGDASAGHIFGISPSCAFANAAICTSTTPRTHGHGRRRTMLRRCFLRHDVKRKAHMAADFGNAVAFGITRPA